VRDLERFERDWATVKVNWTLDGPIPWTAPEARRAPVVHVGGTIDDLSAYAGEVQRGKAPSGPFLVVGQYGVADASRAPAGKDTAWAYTHVPHGLPDDEVAAVAGRIDAQLERYAPGFGALVRRRVVQTPDDLEAANASLVGGAVGGGTSQLHGQGPFRPMAGLGRPATPVRRLYLASSSAHPGGGVHGACGWNAAHAALRTRLLRSV
jgi:phytoene dehydrogenase-like protein